MKMHEIIYSTKELIAYLTEKQGVKQVGLVQSYVNAIVKCGTISDAQLVLAYFLENSTDYISTYLFPIFKKFGNQIFAEQIFNVSMEGNKWNDKTNPETLELLASLQYEPVKPILADIAFSESDYYLSKYAVLGLLHFDCKEYQLQIKSQIESCLNQPFFSEFIPALVCKLEIKERDELLDKLFDLGENIASTDCNAGIILGFSLSGEKGAFYFKKVLFDSRWETASSGTGTVYFVYQGIKKLNIHFEELYEEVKANQNKENFDVYLEVFFALIKQQINDTTSTDKDCYRNLYDLLFRWKDKNKSDNLIDLARKVGKVDEAYQIENFLKIKLYEEAILKNWNMLGVNANE